MPLSFLERSFQKACKNLSDDEVALVVRGDAPYKTWQEFWIVFWWAMLGGPSELPRNF